MFTQIYNDFIFLLQIITIVMISIIAIILMPYVIKFVISKIYNIITKMGYVKSNIRNNTINFDEFDDIEEVKMQEHKNKQEMQHEYEVLEQVYNESFDRDYYDNQDNNLLNIVDIIDAQRNVEEAKEDLYNFKVLDSVKVKEKRRPEGRYILDIKENQKNFDAELFKNWSMQIFKCIKLGKEEELKIVEKVMTHQMYNKLLNQTKKFKKDGLEFITEDLIIKEVSIIDYAKTISKEEIKVLVKVKMKEYIIDTNTSRVLRGNNKKSYEKKIVMTFLKHNADEKEGFITNCPNCGAESTQVEFGKCRYCDTLVFPIRYNWTLIKFETM